VRPSAEAAVPPDAVLAEWTLEPYEWLAFYHQEADARRRSAVKYTLVGAVLGAMISGLFTGRSQSIVAGAALLGLAALVATLVSAARMRKRDPHAGGAVVVRRNAVEVDGVLRVLRDGEWWISSAKVRDDLPLSILQLTTKRTHHRRNGSKETVEKVFRVPIPRDREADARRIADELARGVVDGPEDD
jgi:hypothetical protein